jgi:ribosomal protein S27E
MTTRTMMTMTTKTTTKTRSEPVRVRCPRCGRGVMVRRTTSCQCGQVAKHEIESHGGEWPPKVTQQEDVFKIEIEEEKPVVHTSPLAVDMPVPEPEPPSPKKKISIKVKKNKKGGRK